MSSLLSYLLLQYMLMLFSKLWLWTCDLFTFILSSRTTKLERCASQASVPKVNVSPLILALPGYHPHDNENMMMGHFKTTGNYSIWVEEYVSAHWFSSGYDKISSNSNRIIVRSRDLCKWLTIYHSGSNLKQGTLHFNDKREKTPLPLRPLLKTQCLETLTV